MSKTNNNAGIPSLLDQWLKFVKELGSSQDVPDAPIKRDNIAPLLLDASAIQRLSSWESMPKYTHASGAELPCIGVRFDAAADKWVYEPPVDKWKEYQSKPSGYLFK